MVSPPDSFAIHRIAKERDAAFVGCLLAPGHSLWRVAWISWILLRIVVAGVQGYPRAFRQFERLLERIGGLPVEVPIGDADELSPPAVRLGRGYGHLLPQQ